MKKRFTFCVLLGSLVVFNTSRVKAQALSSDSLSQPEQRAEALFNSAIKLQSRLYNGTLYRMYGATVEGSANFQDLPSFVNGHITYDGANFPDVPLLYDMYLDKVVTRLGKENMIGLVSSKVSQFSINGHLFKYVHVADTTKSVLKPGFFDVIYDGKEKILAKRIKRKEFSAGNAATEYYFTSKTSYYLQRGDQYFVVNGESDFLNLHKDKRNELKSYIKQQKIKFKKQPEEAMIRLTRYYDSLSR